MTPAAPRYLSAALSDQGQVRQNNEDRVYADDVRGFFMVVDGMGGHEAGEHAADIALERLRLRLERQTGTVEQRIREAITLANNAVFEAGRSRPDWNGMACVLTVAVIEDGRVTVGHVGDSRLYQIRRGGIRKITHDHSPVGEREDRGEITEAEAMQHPRRNEVYRDVGSEEHTPDDPDFIEVLQFAFEPDSALLLCSDGLSDAIPSKDILGVIEQNAGDRRAAVRGLISAASQTGKDNISAVLVEGDQFAASFGRPRRSGNRRTNTEAPGGDSTGRIEARSAPASVWYRNGLLWLLCGILLGALLTFGLITWLTPKPVSPPQVLTVLTPATITGTLEKTRAGDTVLVPPGTYKETVTLREGVDLIARRPHEAIIDGAVVAEGIQHARFEGFQVRASGTGIRLHDSDVILSRNDVAGAAAAGVEFAGNSRGALVGCWIHNNTGPGVLVADSSLPDIENNVIVANGTQPRSPGPGLQVRSMLRPRIAGNVFIANGAEPIWLAQPDPGIVERNYFFGPPRAKKPTPPIRIVPAAEVRRESR